VECFPSFATIEVDNIRKIPWSSLKIDETFVLLSKHTNKINFKKILDINQVNKQVLITLLTEEGTIIVNYVH